MIQKIVWQISMTWKSLKVSRRFRRSLWQSTSTLIPTRRKVEWNTGLALISSTVCLVPSTELVVKNSLSKRLISSFGDRSFLTLANFRCSSHLILLHSGMWNLFSRQCWIKTKMISRNWASSWPHWSKTTKWSTKSTLSTQSMQVWPSSVVTLPCSGRSQAF